MTALTYFSIVKKFLRSPYLFENRSIQTIIERVSAGASETLEFKLPLHNSGALLKQKTSIDQPTRNTIRNDNPGFGTGDVNEFTVN